MLGVVMNRIRALEAAEATAELRRREDGAPRLRQEVPALRTLRLRFQDIRKEGQVTVASYVRPVVVAQAPAHFEIRCMEPRCDGRYDLTREILRSLRAGEVAFTGSSECRGMVGDVGCDRVLSYVGEAAYTG
jgi:hypothetical protein